ncbi:DEKNAAC101248 [Brettanomyces naardenensis]|uniref:DEKNAAC101248 n=1 Tax=Brettanomyces naardenensis TaxID=13370 RepID=A0A448YHN4_BRENA|nr:DEKNAAC101248 [Brettanomyces naardenensis]
MDFPQFFTIPATGDKIPVIGFGSGTRWQIKKKSENGGAENSGDVIDRDLVDVLKLAVKHGFVHIDTAEVYTTRKDVGAALKEIDLPREKLWITDKYKCVGRDIKPNHQGPYDSLKEGLEYMGVDYVDAFLVHTGFFSKEYPLEKIWPEMERLYEEGLAHNIGVSNFDVPTLEKLFKLAKHKPQVLQIEFHPYLQNQAPGVVKFAKDNGILVEAYSPLAPLSRAKDGPLRDLLPKLSEKYGRSATQILLKWAHQQGVVTVTTTANEQRMDDILGLFDFELSEEDEKRITDTGNSYFFRAFAIPPLPKYDEELKKERGLV